MRRAVSIAFISLLATLAVPWRPASANLSGPDYPNVVYRTVGDVTLTLDIYLPTGRGPFPGVLVTHGAIRQGDKTDYAGEAQILSDNGFAAFAANYRMSCDPAAPPPDVDPKLCGYHAIVPVQDLLQAVKWIRAHAASYKTIPTKVGAFGGSFGGNLVQMLGTLGKPGKTKPNVVTAWSGSSELWKYAEGGDPERAYSIRLAYCGCPFEGPGSCPDVWYEGSPISYVNGNDVPTYLANGSFEEVPLVEATDMQAALTDAGVPVFLRVIPGDLHARAYEDYVVDGSGTTVFMESIEFLHTYLD